MSCPICGQQSAPSWWPFCSRRCADVDLGRWINGSYAIPAEDADPVPEDADETSAAPGKPH